MLGLLGMGLTFGGLRGWPPMAASPPLGLPGGFWLRRLAVSPQPGAGARRPSARTMRSLSPRYFEASDAEDTLKKEHPHSVATAGRAGAARGGGAGRVGARQRRKGRVGAAPPCPQTTGAP
jgi:hypothetical protein